MAKREHCGIYQMRFERLWAALAMCDAKKAGEMSPTLVAGIIGCSVRHAQRLIRRKIRYIVSKKWR
ncbi:MAG: hypothetical protein WC959_07605 [Kiritimatiellales bacterium]